MNRRTLLTAAGAAMISAPAAAQGVSNAPLVAGASLVDEPGRIGWDEFLARAGRDAQALRSNRSQAGQDAYLHAIAQHAALLGEFPDVEPNDFGGLQPSYSLDLIHRGSPFIVLYWRMEPNAIFPAHCHPVSNVCTLCTGGSATIRNFEPADSAPPCWSGSEDEFDLIETRRERLDPGVINLVTEHRDNMHMFVAGPAGAEGLDITTSYEAARPFSFARFGASTHDASGAARIRARWVGRDPRRAL